MTPYRRSRPSTRTAASLRLFMVPGMGHCESGDGTDSFDKMTPLVKWVERGTPPDRIVAAHESDGKIVRTRPLCPYGRVARWTGTGSTDDERSFTCEAR